MVLVIPGKPAGAHLMRKLLIILLLLLSFPVLADSGKQGGKIDINNATLEQINLLPLPEGIKKAIYNRVVYEGPFQSLYELMDISGFTTEMLIKVKPLIIINPYVRKEDWETRLDRMLYQMERWEGSEGANQVLVDYWYEQAVNPLYINDVRYDQLANLQGVSPVDAASILKYRKLLGKINNARDLRSASNLSYYGYRNARSFLSFDKPGSTKEFHGHWRVRMDDTPLMADEADADAQIPETFLSEMNYPAFHSVYTATYGKDFRIGFSQYHAYSEPYQYSDLGFMQIPKYKFYLGIENKKWKELNIRKIYVGNYSLSFAKGVVMNNTDYFSSRNSGYGFRKSFVGLSGDVSINRQFSFNGLATELSYRNLDAWFFASYSPRDAILNVHPDYINGEPEITVNHLIVLDQRYDYAPSDYTRRDNELSWLDAVNEVTYGGRFQYNFAPGNYIGTTFYESLYDRYLRPDYKEIVAPENYGLLGGTDAEIFAAYGGTETDIESPLWSDARSSRRVYGLDFQYVYKSVALQGEYATLDKKYNYNMFDKDNPHAMVFNAYWQYNSFNLLALYREYDLDFDNPYQRSFANYRRYKKTIFEDYFYLVDPLYGQLASNNPQPQAEKGFYLNGRYQMNRYLISTFEYDNWRRQSDDASYYRLRFSMDIRPKFPIRINLRQKYQGREVNNELSLLYYMTDEFRGTLRFLLSDYNELSLFYVNSTTLFTPRPRLIFEPDADGIDSAHLLRSGNAEAPGDALGGGFRYRVGDWLKLKGSLMYYNGFFWNFEDTQFQVMNSINGAFRSWVALYTRLSSKFSVHAKLTWDHQLPVTDVEARNSYNELLQEFPVNTGIYYSADLVVQDKLFYLFELNYHF